MIELRGFGGLSIEPHDADPARRLNPQRKALALLAMLASADNRAVSRDVVQAYLWPESDAEQAQNALAQLLFRIRRELGADAVTGTRELRLNPDVVIADCARFDRDIAEGRLESAVGLYRGPFLDGFHLRDAPEFERWCDDQRRRRDDAYCDALERLAVAADADGDPRGTARWWRRRLDAHPLNARAARAYVVSLLAVGDTDAARRFIAAHDALMRSELGHAPDAELASLMEAANVAAAVRSARTAAALPSPLSTGFDGEPTRVPSRAPTDNAGPSLTRAASRWRIAFPLLLLLVLAGVAASRWMSRRPRVAQTPTVLVASFDVSGDSTLRPIARVAEELIVQAITRSGVVGVVNANSSTGRRDQRARALDAGQEFDQLTELARRVGATVIVDARLVRRVDSLHLSARIVDARTGRVLRAPAPVATSATADFSPAFGELANRVLGSLASVVDRRIAPVLDPSAPPPRFEAYREYVDGLDAFVGRWTDMRDYPVAIAHFARAATLDSNFTLPYVWMVFAYRNSGRFEAADSVVDLLAKRRERLPTLDLLAVDYFLADRKPGMAHCREQYRAATAASQIAPESNWTFLRARAAECVEQIDTALVAMRQLDSAQAWIQDWAGFWIAYRRMLDEAGYVDEQLAAAERGTRISHDVTVYQALFTALGATGGVARVDHLIDSLSAVVPDFASTYPGPWLTLATREAIAHEHASATSELARRCAAWYGSHVPRADSVERNAMYHHLTMWSGCEYMAKRYDTADSLLGRAEAYQPSDLADLLYERVAVYLRRGDSVAFRTALAKLYSLPGYEPNAPNRLGMELEIAEIRGDVAATLALGGRYQVVQPTYGHDDPDVSPELRRAIATTRKPAPF